MNSLACLTRFALVTALFWVAAPGLAFADDVTPPVVSVPVADLTVPAGTGQSVVNLRKTFALTGVTGKLVRFSTSVGSIDVEMLADAAPKTVETFLGYARAAGDNNSGVYSYTNTLIQHAVRNLVVQGGGYYVDSDERVNEIVGRPTIPSEAGVKNTRGTLAMALSTGPDSATGDWLFNVVDNPGRDISDPNDPQYDGGPFTVFGRCIGSLATLDAIEALPMRDLGQDLGAAFTAVPLINFDGSTAATTANLVYTKSITNLPLTPKVQGGVAALKLAVKGNTNPDLVTASLDGRKLTLTYAPGVTGSSTITLMAKNPVTKSKVKTTFTVTVVPGR